MTTTEPLAASIEDIVASLLIELSEFGERLSQATTAGAHAPRDHLSDATLVARADALLTERRMRRDYFPSELFDEPAWAMLLTLFVARDEGQPMNISSLAETSGVPITTLQRWIDHLHKLELIDRAPDMSDRRRVEISLSSLGDKVMTSYLRTMAKAC